VEHRIDLLLNGDLGMWIDENFQWEFGNVHRFWKDAGQSWEASLSDALPSEFYAAISAHWPEKIPTEKITRYKYFFNIHPGYLPIGRGMYPVFWSVFLREIAGATTHQITNVLDEGPILFRDQVPFDDQATGGEVWEKVLEIEKRHFMDLVELLKNFPEEFSLFIDSGPKGPNRKKLEFMKLRDNPPLSEMKVDEVDRLVRALTNPRYPTPKWILEKENKV